MRNMEKTEIKKREEKSFEEKVRLIMHEVEESNRRMKSKLCEWGIENFGSGLLFNFISKNMNKEMIALQERIKEIVERDIYEQIPREKESGMKQLSLSTGTNLVNGIFV